MQVLEITNQKQWNEFVLNLNLNTFLHSNSWIEFNQQHYNYKYWQLGLFDDNNNLQAVAFILKIDAKRGKFLFCPHGPQGLSNTTETNTSLKIQELQFFTDYLKILAKQENCSFIRLQPILNNTAENSRIFTQLGFRKAPIHMHTELSTVVNIDQTEDRILLGMRKTTRQMVKKGLDLIKQKKVEVQYYNEISDELYEVYESTGKRGNFVIYSQKFLQNEYQSFSRYQKTSLYAVKYKGKILSWGMVLFSGKRAFYHQGANILNKDIPASYICQWTGIQKARENGCKTYDFWGVSPVNSTNHPWAKISVFKRGFGGQDIELLHAQDLVLNWKYWINWLIESYRAKKRGFV